MMQGNNKIEQFDLQVRAMLADAQEEVPESVWEAVSARIGAAESAIAPRGKGHYAWWTAAGVSFAAAAAVAVVSVLPHNSSVEIRQEMPELISPVRHLIAESIQKPVKMLPDYTRSLKKLTTPDSPALRVSTEEKAEESPVKEEAPIEENSKISNNKTEQNSNDWEDPFKAMEMAERAASKRSAKTFFVGAGGNLASNGDNVVAHTSRFSSISNGALGKPKESTVTESSLSVYGVPVSFGLQIGLRLSGKLYLGSGLNYSLLTRTFSGTFTQVEDGEAKAPVDGEIYNELHYLGVPLGLYYNIVEKSGFNFYCFAGGTVEKALVNKFVIENNGKIFFNQAVPGVQFSAQAGLGVLFGLTDRIGLYIDPSLNYYFNCGQPKSVRTQRPFMLSFELGFRFNI